MLFDGTPCAECPVRKFDEVGVKASSLTEMTSLFLRIAPWAGGMEECFGWATDLVLTLGGI
jgi:hypothetical protein